MVGVSGGKKEKKKYNPENRILFVVFFFNFKNLSFSLC